MVSSREWAEVALGDICLPVATHNPRERPTEAIRYIDIGSIDRQRIGEVKDLAGKDAPSRARQIVHAGDTVLSTVRTNLKNTALVPPELDGATASTGFCVLRPNGDVEPRFLYYRVVEQSFVNDLSAQQTGSSYPAVRGRNVLSMRIRLPPFDEQRRIVDAIEERFSHLDDAVEGLQRALANLSSLKQQALAAGFEGHWPWTILGDIADIAGGVTKDSKNQGRPGLVEVPYLRVANVQRGYFDLADVTTIRVTPEKLAALALQPGDVLFNEGGDRDKLGRGWVWDGQIDPCIHQNHVFRARLQPGFDPRFVSWHGNTFGQKWFWDHGKQTTNLASLNLTTLKRFPVPSPPIGEQQRIVAEAERHLSLVSAMRTGIESALSRSESLRQSILRAALVGEATRD